MVPNSSGPLLQAKPMNSFVDEEEQVAVTMMTMVMLTTTIMTAIESR